jgi:hypothetical protein
MQVDGIVISALMGLGALIVGLIIIRLTPEQRAKR